VLEIDADLKQFFESGVDVIVGTSDSHNLPHIVRAWGPKVLPNGTAIDLFVDLPKGADVLRDLRETGRVAVIFVLPETARAVQIKGRCLEIGDAESDDLPWIDNHRQAFARGVAPFGYAPHIVRSMWSTQVKRVRISAETAFDQTPGPGAGKPL
jgi:hypothetical protein